MWSKKMMVVVWGIIIPLGLLIINGGIGQLFAQEPCTLYVDPHISSAPPNDSFKINFCVKDVPQPGCYGWQIHLWWDASILHLKRVQEGPFLQQGGYTTIFVVNYDDTANGRVLFMCCRLGPVPGQTGDGILAYGYFSVKQQGQTWLKMDTVIGGWKTYLLDTTPHQIPCEIINGYFIYPVGVEEGKKNYLSERGCWINTPYRDFLDLSYYLPEASRVQARLYNISGKMVMNLFDCYESAGMHKKRVRCHLTTGVYFLYLQTKDRTLAKKIILLR